MSNRPKRKPSSKPARKPVQAPSVWPKRLATAGGLLLALVLVVVVAFQQPPPRGVPEGTETLAVGDPRHVDGDLYDDTALAPAGGPHAPVWLNCGVYEDVVPAENALHSLEHCAVWITYRPDIGTDGARALRRLAPPRSRVIVSPVPNQEAPVVATAWARRLQVDSPGDSRLDQFVREFTTNGVAPEPTGRCDGGVGRPTS